MTKHHQILPHASPHLADLPAGLSKMRDSVSLVNALLDFWFAWVNRDFSHIQKENSLETSPPSQLQTEPRNTSSTWQAQHDELIVLVA